MAQHEPSLWTQVDGYCERTDFTFWSEPVNAVTNAAFLVAALIVAWRQIGRPAQPSAIVLTVTLTAIGIGSFLFHTFATGWAGLADVLPILIFILVYIFIASKTFLGWPVWAAGLATLGFFPYAFGAAAVIGPIIQNGASALYASVAILVAVYAALLWRRAPETARGLAIGAAILAVSIAARTVDEPLCEAIPLGTHWIWHCLNGLMLGWMIHVLMADRDRRLAGAGARV